MIKIAVRLDDITPDMDWEKFLAFQKLLDEFHIKPLIGIVPFNQDRNLQGSDKGKPEDFWNYVKELQKDGYTIALHGYTHQYTTNKGGIFPLNHFSEFAGLPYQKQEEMIREGKEELLKHGIDTDIFMAPAHSYDRNTLLALKKNGFRALTDGFGAKPYQREGLTFYPISFLWKRTLQKSKGYSTLVVHTGTVENIESYRAYFANKQVEWINYSEYLKAKSIKQTIWQRVSEYALACTKGCIGRLR